MDTPRTIPKNDVIDRVVRSLTRSVLLTLETQTRKKIESATPEFFAEGDCLSLKWKLNVEYKLNIDEDGDGLSEIKWIE